MLGIIAEHGFSCISADQVAAEILDSLASSGELAEKLGGDCVKDGKPERESIRERVLEDPAFRHRLNELLHKPTIQKIIGQTEGNQVHFVEMPLLIETATQGLFDQVWVVSAGKKLQRQRLIERLGDESLADKLLSLQLPTEVKLAFANQIQRTDLPIDTVRLQVEKRLQELN